MFDLPAFSPGSLEATGLIGGQAATAHRIATPGRPAGLAVEIDTAGIFAAVDEPDVLIAHARLLDAQGTLCLSDTGSVAFTVEGGAELLGPASVAAEAGIASVVLRVSRGCVAFALQATRSGPEGVFVAECTWRRRGAAVPMLAPA